MKRIVPLFWVRFIDSDDHNPARAGGCGPHDVHRPVPHPPERQLARKRRVVRIVFMVEPLFKIASTSATEILRSNIRCAACCRMSSWSREIMEEYQDPGVQDCVRCHQNDLVGTDTEF